MTDLQLEFWRVVKVERPKMVRYLNKFKRGADWSYDIVMDAVTKCYPQLNTIEQTDKIKSWLWSCVVNYARTQHIRDKETLVAEIRHDSGVNIEQQFINTSDVKLVLSIANEMPDIQGEVFRLRFIDGMSFKEIASTLDCPYNTAKANYRHAWLRVKPYLLDQILLRRDVTDGK